MEVRKPARETASRTSGTRKKLKSLLECVVRKRLEDSIASNYEKDITWHSVPKTSFPEYQWIVNKSRIPRGGTQAKEEAAGFHNNLLMVARH